MESRAGFFFFISTLRVDKFLLEVGAAGHYDSKGPSVGDGREITRQLPTETPCAEASFDRRFAV